MIDWGAFLVVLLVAVVAACFVVSVYSTGLRLWSTADTMAGKDGTTPDGTNDSAAAVPAESRRSGPVGLVRAGAVLCFLVSALTVLYGIYLIVPQFHG